MASSTILGGDFTVDYDLKTITHSAGTTVYTVNALYSALQDLFDELTQLDDPVPMSAQTPTEYTLINSWFMDEPSFQYLKGGAIKTLGWNQGATYPTGIRVLTFNSSGYVNLTGTDIGKPVVGTTTTDSGTLLFYDNTLRIWWVRADALDDTFDTSEEVTVTGGTNTSGNSTTAAAVTGEHVFANIYTLGTIEGGGYTLNGALTSGVSTSVVVNETIDSLTPQTGYVHIFDNTGLIEYEYAYTSWTGSTFTLGAAVTNDHNSGNVANAYGLMYVIQNGSKLTGWWPNGHIDVLTRITDWDGTEIDNGQLIVFLRRYGHLYDHFPIDLSSGGRNAVPLATAKDSNNITDTTTVSGYSDITITHGSVSKDLNNGNGSKNYDITINCNSRRLAQVYEYLKYVTRRTSTFSSGGTDGEQYIAAQSTYAPVKASPYGTFAGGKFFGARGVWIEGVAAEDIKQYQLLAADNTIQSPPNSVAMNVTGVVSGDRIAVFVLTGAGGSIDKSQFTLNGAQNNTSTLIVNEAIPGDTPLTGYIRVVDQSTNVEYRYEYTSWATSTFTLTGATGNSHADGDGVYVPIIDKEATGTSVSNTLIHSTDIYVRAIVRKKGIIPFEQDTTITDQGGSVAAIRTTDTIVA